MLSGTCFAPPARRVPIERARKSASCDCLPGKSAAVVVAREGRRQYARGLDRDITCFDSIRREFLLLAMGKCPDRHHRPPVSLRIERSPNALVLSGEAAVQSRTRAMPRRFNCRAQTGTCFAPFYL